MHAAGMWVSVSRSVVVWELIGLMRIFIGDHLNHTRVSRGGSAHWAMVGPAVQWERCAESPTQAAVRAKEEACPPPPLSPQGHASARSRTLSVTTLSSKTRRVPIPIEKVRNVRNIRNVEETTISWNVTIMLPLLEPAWPRLSFEADDVFDLQAGKGCFEPGGFSCHDLMQCLKSCEIYTYIGHMGICYCNHGRRYGKTN